MQTSRIQALYLEYSNDVHKFLVYFTRSWDVDDLVQETFMKALKGIDQYRGGNARAWLLAIARNVAIDHLRRLKRVPFADEAAIWHLPSADPSPEDLVAFKDEEQWILRILADMKPNYRDVIICRAFMNMSAEETGQVLNWSRNRVDVTLHRAIKALRASLIKHSGGGLNDLAKGR
ncbi:MAG: RNA polymerase sigma factor [Alicyclobacillus sp.]|nr:RNA polymerase sigma factor [Alicyclobacillus sp.]